MYNEFFGLREKPFNIAPDPRYFYLNAAYREAEARILEGIQARQGFVLLTGEVGVGKTTLLRRLMLNREKNVHCAYFYNTRLSFEELLAFVCEDFKIDTKGHTRIEILKALHAFLVEKARVGETAVIFIDEAQNLATEVLEELRLLSNLETAQGKLLQIVLVGQPELEEKLRRPELRQVDQRVAVRCKLRRLANREIGDFIIFRLRIAGCQRSDIFPADVVQWIAHYSEGLPRLINKICDHALESCWQLSQPVVTTAVIREAAVELGLQTVEEEKPQRPEFELRQILEEATYQEFKRQDRKRWVRRALPWAALVLVNTAVLAYIANPFRATRPARVGEVPARGAIELTAGGAVNDMDPAGAEQRDAPSVGFGERPPGPIREMETSAGEQISAAEPATPVEVAGASRLPENGRGSNGTGDRVTVVGVARAEAQHDGVGPNDVPLFEPLVKTDDYVVVGQGESISEIVARAYGPYDYLAMDLIQEVNPELGDVNLIRTGQVLNLPVLDQRTLLRESSDDTYRLIFAVYGNRRSAAETAQRLREHGYVTRITVKKVARNLSLFRVEIVDLPRQRIEEAWSLVKAAKNGALG